MDEPVLGSFGGRSGLLGGTARSNISGEGSDGTVNPCRGDFLPFVCVFVLSMVEGDEKFELFKSNADGSMRRFKELSGSRERRCLETLEDREREMGELRAAVHSKEKGVERRPRTNSTRAS